MASNRMSNLLDFVFGSEECVRLKRISLLTNTYRKFICGSTAVAMLITGSQSDGSVSTHGLQSDTDVMYIFTEETVKCMQDSVETNTMSIRHLDLPSFNAFARNNTHTYHHLCLTRSIKPIIVWDKDISESIKNSCVWYNGELFVSSALFVLNSSKTGNISGPSTINNMTYSTDIGCDNDNVYAFQCPTWPVVANEWLLRKRRFSWPNIRCISYIKSTGCQYVPVGEYNSPFKSLEWRLSFVLAERCLVLTFSHVQFKVYGVMKYIKKLISNKYRNDTTGDDIVTSYHIKTIMFWIVENTPRYIWTNDNLIFCIGMCVLWLRSFLNNNLIPHYFIPTCNLLKKSSHRENQQAASLLNSLTNQTSLINILLTIMDPVISVDISHSSLNNQTRNVFMVCESVGFFGIMIRKMLKPANVLKYMVNMPNELDNVKYYLNMKFLSYALYCRYCIEDILQPIYNNKTMYIYRRQMKRSCLLLSHLDSARGWLQLGTYFYVTGQYRYTEQICKSVIDSSSTWGIVDGNVLYPHILENTLELGNVSFSSIVKHVVACRVVQFQDSLHLNELELEIEEQTMINMPPLPFAHFCLFLCAHRLHDHCGQMEHIRVLMSLVHDRIYGLNPYDYSHYVIFNILGICFEMVQDKRQAVYYYSLGLLKRNAYKRSARQRMLYLMEDAFRNQTG